MLRKFSTKKYIMLALVLVLGLSLTGCKKDEVVATVDNVNITKDELYDALVKQHGSEVLESLISEKIIELEVSKAKIGITTEEIEAEFNKMANYYGGVEILNEAMKNYDMTRKDMDDNIKMNLSIKKLVSSDIVIEEEVAEE